MKYLSPILLISCAVADMRSPTDSVSTDIIEETDEKEEEDSPIPEDLDREPISFDDTGLPDLQTEMDASVCENTNGIPSATNYIVGTYIENNQQWEGKEIWFVLPNTDLQESGFVTCQVSWNITVRNVTDPDCDQCDLDWIVEGEVNHQETTCPQTVWDGPNDTSWSSHYGVDIQKDQSTFYFQSSEQDFGWGFANNRAMNFITEPSCSWF